jgi:hypothetical protein
VADPWCRLTTRFGKSVSSPDRGDLHRALKELFNEKIPGLSEVDYAEHPSSWLEYGLDSGALYVLDVHRKGRVVFATYANQDDALPAEEYELSRLPPEDIEELWLWLRDGAIDRIRAMPWRAT